MADMTNDEIRRYRLNELIEQHGSVAALARLMECTPSQVSQWRNASPDSKTGKPRNMSDGAARRIEERFDKPRGWMDTPPNIVDTYPIGSANALTLHVAEHSKSAAEIEEKARSLSARANEVAAMWMNLEPARRDEIERMLIDETRTEDNSIADSTLISTAKRTRRSVKSGSD